MARNDGVDRTSVRNLAVSDKAVGNTQQHNEREKDSYRNPDIIPQRAAWNVHFKKPTARYTDLFAQLETAGTISTRSLKPDATHYCEIVFDVNSAYFDNHGGYEFAKQFYEDAYKAAVQIVGGEQYILSAVIIKVFPDKLERSTTSLILKSTKTASSCRTIFMTSALKEELKKWLKQLAADERKDPTRYHDSGMLFRLPNGLAVEPVLIRKKFLKWQDAHPEFPRIVFHGLRHSSATYQLMISGGDVKAVQGTTGHATADMLVNTYAHIQQSSRVELGKKFEEGFYAKSESPSPQAVPAAGEPTISMTALLELLKNADPEVKAQLRLALLT